MTKETAAMDWSDQNGSAPAMYQSFLVPAIFVPFAERLVELAGVGPGERVLDVACGTGAVSREAARRAGPEGSVTGVDLGAPMLEVAQAQPLDDGAAPIEYLEGDADQLPVDDAGFDVVLCHQGLQFFPDREHALSEMRRALRDGGRAAIGTWSSVDHQPHFVALSAAFRRHIGPDVAAMIEAPFSLHDPDQLRTLLEGAGFRDVGIVTETLPTIFASHAEFARRMLAAGPVGPVFAAADPAQQDAVAADVADALRDRATPDGRLASSMTSLIAVATA